MAKKHIVRVNHHKSLAAIITWMWNKEVWYGDLFTKWWTEEGAEVFGKFANKHRAEFQKEPDMKLLKEIYMTCIKGK